MPRADAAALLLLGTWRALLVDAAYNEPEAKLFLEYARATFCEGSRIAAWDCGESCLAAPVLPGQVRYIPPGGTWAVQGLVAAIPGFAAGTCVVGFRGSVNLANYLADANIVKTSWPQDGTWTCPGCLVHSGFAQAYAELRGGVTQALRDLGCKQAVAVGHSLGAAVAQLAALDIRAGLGLPGPSPYLYGCPKVGNALFADVFNEAFGNTTAPSAWRVVHFKDPVPHLPPEVWKTGLVHVGQEIWYNDGSTYHNYCNASDPYRPPCAGSISFWDSIVNAMDHTMYLNKTTRHAALPKECTTPTFSIVV